MGIAPAEVVSAPAAPRGVAISGIVFSLLYLCSVVLIRLAVPADPAESGAWLSNPVFRNWIGISLILIPFAGIAFLWFMAVIRNHIGLLEDQFFATVFLGSGLLFVAMLFTAGAVSQALLGTFSAETVALEQRETYEVGRRLAHALMAVFGTRVAAVFMCVTSTIGLRTNVLPHWISAAGFVCAFTLLLVIAEFAWIALLFPGWVLLVSTWILLSDLRKEAQASIREVNP